MCAEVQIVSWSGTGAEREGLPEILEGRKYRFNLQRNYLGVLKAC